MTGSQSRLAPHRSAAPGTRATAGETLAQAAYRALRSDIISGVRMPGERLRLDKLKAIYGIGPTPLREALQMLAVDQLVLAEGNRGFTVERLDPDEFNDLNIARTAIETAALQLSIKKGDTAWEAGVVAAAYIMAKEDETLMKSGGSVSESWEQANSAFHTSLVAACGSRSLLNARSDLQDKCTRYRRASLHDKRGLRNLADEHAAISRAVLARDIDLACRLTARHFALTASSLSGVEVKEDEA